MTAGASSPSQVPLVGLYVAEDDHRISAVKITAEKPNDIVFSIAHFHKADDSETVLMRALDATDTSNGARKQFTFSNLAGDCVMRMDKIDAGGLELSQEGDCTDLGFPPGGFASMDNVYFRIDPGGCLDLKEKTVILPGTCASPL